MTLRFCPNIIFCTLYKTLRIQKLPSPGFEIKFGKVESNIKYIKLYFVKIFNNLKTF